MSADPPSDPEPTAVADAYLAALAKGDLEAVLALFADGATVRSPLEGEVDASAFFADLFERTARSDITPIQTFDSSGGEAFAAAYFRYDWTLADGRSAGFEVVDVFELDDAGRIERLTILYDAEGVRRQLGEDA